MFISSINTQNVEWTIQVWPLTPVADVPRRWKRKTNIEMLQIIATVVVLADVHKNCHFQKNIQNIVPSTPPSAVVNVTYVTIRFLPPPADGSMKINSECIFP